ncbi:unnamed protein product [Macrosiphum euphorbiae]|uniref:Uncharacterized protein n=1 Tax=Macrosiphum euphorbiae TaxID=13131 RepID=A0AAV0Y9F8_9HEMI|nr:unnamed protein product [Macrosiphum euphorbiae]
MVLKNIDILHNLLVGDASKTPVIPIWAQLLLYHPQRDNGIGLAGFRGNVLAYLSDVEVSGLFYLRPVAVCKVPPKLMANSHEVTHRTIFNHLRHKTYHNNNFDLDK